MVASKRETNSESKSKCEVTKIIGTLKRKTGIKRARTFWHRFVAILKSKTVVPEALKIEREIKFDSFVNNIQLQVRKRQVKHVFGIIRTA